MAIKLGLMKGCHDMLPSDDLAGLFLCKKKTPDRPLKPVWSPYISHPPGLTLAVMTMYAFSRLLQMQSLCPGSVQATVTA